MVMLQLGNLSKLRERQLTSSMAFTSGNVRFRNSLQNELPCSELPLSALIGAAETVCCAPYPARLPLRHDQGITGTTPTSLVFLQGAQVDQIEDVAIGCVL